MHVSSCRLIVSHTGQNNRTTEQSIRYPERDSRESHDMNHCQPNLLELLHLRAEIVNTRRILYCSILSSGVSARLNQHDSSNSKPPFLPRKGSVISTTATHPPPLTTSPHHEIDKPHSSPLSSTFPPSPSATYLYHDYASTATTDPSSTSLSAPPGLYSLPAHSDPQGLDGQIPSRMKKRREGGGREDRKVFHFHTAPRGRRLIRVCIDTLPPVSTFFGK